MPHGPFASVEELIEETRNGHLIVLVDDEDRNSEGSLVVPAQMATPEKINFMARHARGLICLALTRKRIDELGLSLMKRDAGRGRGAAFTTSIEARDGVTTGISAADRARTVAVAIDGSQSSDAIVTPGHVFPLVAREGGVLVRAGHTEAAVDLARLAGLNPAGVICEILNDDGTMARLDDLAGFSQSHELKIGTIRNLIAFRRRHDHLVGQQSTARFESRWGGEWRVKHYRNKATGSKQIALVKGEIDPSVPVLVRMHVHAPFADMFGETGARADLLSRSMTAIAEAGAGVIVILDPPDDAVPADADHGDTKTSETGELRGYGEGAMVLADLGVHDMILLTSSHHVMVGLEGYGLTISATRPIGEGPA